MDAAAIHGDRNQSQRQRALDAFTAGHPRVLVATDVAARGIHVDDVDLVVQFDPPNDHKDYLHRSGRTARAGQSGMVIALVERGQVRELQRLHDAAGVTAASDEVATGHDVVRQIATSGTPVPPRRAPARVTSRGLSAPSRRSGSGRRAPRAAGSTRDGFARGTAKPAAGLRTRTEPSTTRGRPEEPRHRPAGLQVTWSPGGPDLGHDRRAGHVPVRFGQGQDSARRITGGLPQAGTHPGIS